MSKLTLSELVALPDDAIVDGPAAIKITGYTERGIERLRKERLIPYITLGATTVRYRVGDLRAFLKARTIPARTARTVEQRQMSAA